MSKALIFGSTGQDGFYLSKILHSKNIEVKGVSRSKPGNKIHQDFWIPGNVADTNFVEQLIRTEKPELVFHLAADSDLDHGLLFEHHNTIVKGSLNILEAVYRHSPHSKVFITGSGLQFVNTGDPITEQDEFFAANAYTLARIQSVYSARYFRTKGIKTYVGYLFHHDSPLRSAKHLSMKIAEGVKKINKGENFMLLVGNISVEKEFGFAGDVAEGIVKLVDQDNVFEACIGTGIAYSIEKWLELCFSFIGKKWQDHVQIKQDYVSDFKRLVSDPSVIHKLNWKAKTGIEELARMMLTG